ncbi:MAG: hypothetical protein K1060chlam4_00303 [Candidatus Anoxychlamydiales bacterium]|nr:hypothetical protein [Candidatus Anoxychlamydiales bacterium]
MFNGCNIYKINPGIFIGKNLAAYIKHESLDNKIANLANSIFVGFALFSIYYYFLPIPLLKILFLSVSASLVGLFSQAMASGYRKR